MHNSAHQEKQLHGTQEELKKALQDNLNLANEVDDLQKKCTELQGTVQILKITCEEHEATEKDLNAKLNSRQLREIDQQYSLPLLSFTRFRVDDIVLFLRNPSGYYEAFNKDAPYYFLSEESLATFEEEW